MTLGEIKENLAQAGDERTLALASAAHQNAKDTLTELRDLARGSTRRCWTAAWARPWASWPAPARCRSP